MIETHVIEPKDLTTAWQENYRAMSSQPHRTFIYRIDAENRIIFLNQEWLDFAQENRAPDLTADAVIGQQLEKFITGWETQHLFEMIYDRVRQTGQRIRIPFRCDSPDCRREFEMDITLLQEGILEFSVKALKIESRSYQSLLNLERDPGKFLTICSWCKKIKINCEEWIEIEESVEMQSLFADNPPSLTHTVCQDCFAQLHKKIQNAGS